MKSIMISIKPKYVAKILNGEKIIEIRKTMPKCDLPITVYIYCTKEDGLCCIKRIDRDRYICGKDFDLRDFPHLSSGYDGKGKVVAKFTLNKVEEIFWRFICGEWENYTKTLGCSEISQASCVETREIAHYLKGNNGYAWHISNLVIFDRPKELSEFHRKGYEERLKRELEYSGDIAGIVSDTVSYWHRIKKAPQSWFYCESEELL